MADSPRLALVVLDPDSQWTDGGLLERIGEWTKRRGNSPRLYPGSLVWCACKPGKELRRSFLDGSLTRLSDPDAVLRRQLVKFVGRGDFGLASGPLPSGRTAPAKTP